MRRAALPLILLTGLLLRVLYLGEVAALPFFDHPVGDSAVHLARAREILAGAFVPARPFFYGSALYPYLLAGLLALPLGSLYLVGLAQCLAGVGTAWLLGRSAGHLYGERAGVVAAGIAVLYGPFAFLEADFLGVCWGLLALSAAICFLARQAPGTDESGPVRRSRLGGILAAGMALGLAAAERPNLMLLVLPAAAWVASLASSRRWVAAIVLTAGATAGLAPAVLLDRAASGAWSFPGTSSGINLYVGNNPRATGTYDEPWSEEASHFTARYTDLEESSLKMASRLAGRDLAPAEASRFWRDRAVAWVLAEPGSALRLLGRKAALLWNAAEVPNHLNFAFLRSRAPALWLMPLGFGVVATLAVAGAILSLLEARGRAGTILLVLLAVTTAASVLPFFVADRYRAPMVVPMIVLAAAGGTELLRAIAEPRARGQGLGVAVAAALFLGALTQIPMIDPDLSRDHWLFAQAYRARGDLVAARTEYEAAIGEAGEDGVLLNNLAMVQRAMGSRGEAEATLRRAMKADPALAFPHKNLGLLLLGSEASRAEALAELREAARRDPDDAETQGALAALYAERGDRAEAIAAYTKARRLDPNDPRPARLAEQYTFLTEDPGLSTSPRARP